jgi:C4-dicarboxylate transporter DctM subunit
MFIALFVYRDMGPLKGKTWTNDQDAPHARVGFNGMVYGVSFFLVWEIMSFFVWADSETITGGDRAIWGVIMSAMLAIFYVFKRSSKLEESIGTCLLAGMPIWGRNLSMMLRGFFPSLFGEESRKVMLEGTKTTVMLMFIIANALLFAHTLSAERIPQMITEWMLDVGFNWFTFLIAVNILLLIGGQFMEPSGLLVIVAPVVFPIAMQLGIDPIHLGIIMVVNMEIGMITPPIGLNLFVTSGITGMSLARVVKAAMPFVAVLMVFLVLVTYIPALSTALPYSIMGPEIVQ